MAGSGYDVAYCTKCRHVYVVDKYVHKCRPYPNRGQSDAHTPTR